MQDRLKEILSQERLTPARFAELVGVQRSSVSHIISGRNKPSLDFLQKILTNFEHISPDWLVSGKGPYKRSQTSGKTENTGQIPGKPTGKIVFPPAAASAEEEKQAVYHTRQPMTMDKTAATPATKNSPDKDPQSSSDSNGTGSEGQPINQGRITAKTIVKTLLFYDDNTFEAYYPE